MDCLYKDPQLPVEERVADLLSRMTPEEKFFQLFMIPGDPDLNSDKYQSGIFGFQLNSESGGSSVSAQMLKYGSENSAYDTAVRINDIQRFFIEKTRLGIPLIFFDEALHGLVRKGASVFPQAIGMAASFDKALMSQVAEAIADECFSRGIRMVLSPVVNTAQDVRWGRTEETYGEDPFLASEMAFSFVSCFEKKGIVTVPKHFAANIGDGGRDSYPVHFNERYMREYILPSFRSCIVKAESRSIMTSYNSYNGTPCSANKFLLNKILRDEWGFKGFVISDAGAVGGMNDLHQISSGYEDSIMKAVNAGLDVLFQTDFEHYKLFISPFLDGRIAQPVIDRAVSRILRIKFELGLFDDPYVDPDAAAKVNGCKKHRELAKTAALRSTVLLKNKDKILPFSDKIRSIAVIGADATEARLGGYSGPGDDKISILEGIKKRSGDQIKVKYSLGCRRIAALSDGASIDEACRTASVCDIAVIAAGIEEGEFRDRAYLSLPGSQEELILKVASTGTPVVVILVGGSAVMMSSWIDKAGAVLDVWYPGERDGDAVAEILFGDFNPAGRLPVTFPVSEGQLPLFYNHKPTGRGNGYNDLTGEPLFPFGYGISYTSFEYSAIEICPDTIDRNGSAELTVKVTNTGDMAGDEVVQLYIRDELASVARPVIELKGFQRIHLLPGSSETVCFKIAPAMLSMLDEDLNEVTEPGTFKIMIGASSKDIRQSAILKVIN